MLPGVMASYRDFTLSTWLGDALVAPPTDDPATWPEFFHRTCDIVFTGLTPYTMVDVDYQDMPWATADNRMWKQSYHREERARMLELVLKVRDE